MGQYLYYVVDFVVVVDDWVEFVFVGVGGQVGGVFLQCLIGCFWFGVGDLGVVVYFDECFLQCLW